MFDRSLIDLLRERFAAAIVQIAGAPDQPVATGLDGSTGGPACARRADRAGVPDPGVRPAGDPRFGDYQCNAAMALARELRCKPRELAERIKAAADPLLAEMAEPLEVAGPGFLNVRLKTEFVAQRLEAVPRPSFDSTGGQMLRCAQHDEGAQSGARAPHLASASPPAADHGPQPATAPDRLGIPPVASPQRVVVDYSSPNIAKQMHVGHLRSTIIGDVLVRVLSFEGHEVIRQNHVGDWGTQFGMLIAWYATHPLPSFERDPDVLDAIEDDYRAANERFKNDADFAAAAREAVTRLQAREPAAIAVWEKLCAQSRRAFTEIYSRLGVLLGESDLCGESFYHDRLKPTVEELERRLPAAGVAESRAAGLRAEVREDQGALCMFLYRTGGEGAAQGIAEPAFKDPDGNPLPILLRKSDGAYLYASTDLAAVRYRILELGARRILYVVGSPQTLHLEMLFAAARAAGWAGDDVRLEHVSFGQVLGEDRKLLRTRSGGAVKLGELLDEAERRAAALLDAKLAEEDEAYRAGFSDEEKRRIAQRVGVAAVKYFDLARDRNGDYVFSWDAMLALKGNTAPYMMFAYASIRSIFRKAAERFGEPDAYAPGVRLVLNDPSERVLALRLARFRETLDAVAADLYPHVLCAYLYELAADFMRFYNACPVIQAPDEATRLSRMRLCDLTARTLRLGLWLLGIEAIERM